MYLYIYIVIHICIYEMTGSGHFTLKMSSLGVDFEGYLITR
jgi:hypothetical protein